MESQKYTEISSDNAQLTLLHFAQRWALIAALLLPPAGRSLPVGACVSVSNTCYSRARNKACKAGSFSLPWLNVGATGDRSFLWQWQTEEHANSHRPRACTVQAYLWFPSPSRLHSLGDRILHFVKKDGRGISNKTKPITWLTLQSSYIYLPLYPALAFLLNRCRAPATRIFQYLSPYQGVFSNDTAQG